MEKPYYDSQTSKEPEAQAGGWFINLGITGARGKLLPTAPMVMEVAYVFKDTPAFGKLEKGDKIIGVNGKLFKTPHKFGGRTANNKFGYEGPMMDIGNALEDSQGTTLNGKLTFRVKRGSETLDVILKISTKYGQFGKTFPFNDKKSDLILKDIFSYLMKNNNNGNWSRFHLNALAALAMIATKEPKYLATAKKVAKSFAASTESTVPLGGLSNWRYTIGGIVLAEYYLATGKKWVLPELTEIRDALLDSQSMKDVKTTHGGLPAGSGPGGWGHNRQFEGYGPMNITTGQALTTLGLIEQCGIKVPNERIIAAHKFMDRGTNKWGYVWYSDKGKGGNGFQAGMGNTGIAAIAHFVNLSESKSFKKLALSYAKAIGSENSTFPDNHGDSLLGLAWTAVGASLDPKAYRKLMDNHKWYFNLAQNPDGTFYNQPHRQHNDQNHKAGPRITATCTMALIFAIKYKSLRIMGGDGSLATTSKYRGLSKKTPPKRQALKLSEKQKKKLQMIMFATLLKISDSNGLKAIPLTISKTRKRVWLAKISPEAIFTFQLIGGKKQVDFKFDDLSSSDKTTLSRLIAVLKPQSKLAQALAGIYTETAGNSTMARNYFKKSNEESIKKIEALLKVAP